MAPATTSALLLGRLRSFQATPPFDPHTHGNHHEDMDEMPKEILELYGARLLVMKQNMQLVAPTIANDPMEFEKFQQTLRGRGLMTDAAVQQSLHSALHKHAQTMHHRPVVAQEAEVVHAQPSPTSVTAFFVPPSPSSFKATNPPLWEPPTTPARKLQ